MPGHESKGDVIVAGISARILTQSARRSGYQVTAVDCFADQDTCVAAKQMVRTDTDIDEPASALVGAINRLDIKQASLVYGGGFEKDGDSLGKLAARFNLLGNAPQVLRRLQDPEKFLVLLRKLHILYPESTLKLPNDERDWLCKQTDISGGLGVRMLMPASRITHKTNSYYQRRLPGAPVSVTFVASRDDIRLLSCQQIYTYALDAERPFIYAGALNRTPMTKAQVDMARDYALRLTRELGLQGINGIDLILSDGRLFFLELNPRPTATLDLLPSNMADNWFQLHVDACRGGRLPQEELVCSTMVRGHRVVYTASPLTIDNSIAWPSWVSDIPWQGSYVGANQPLCTVYAEGPTVMAVEQRLVQRAVDIMQQVQETGNEC